MKRKSVTLISSVVVLCVLCVGYYGIRTYVSKQEEAEEESEEETIYVLSVNSDDIESLKFVIDKTEVEFSKDGDKWIKTDEEEFPVDQDILTSAAESISSVAADRVLNDVEDLNEYELDSPQNTITVTTDEGDETVLRIGMENESVSQYYVEKGEEESTVYLVDSATIDPFMNSLYDYAAADTFPNISAEDITNIEVDEDGYFYEMEEDVNTGFWYVSDGDEEGEKADSAKAESLTSAVSTLEYNSFVDYNCTDLSQYGLNNPYGTITVYYNEEAEAADSEAETEDNADTSSQNADSSIEEDSENSVETTTEEESDEESTEETDTEIVSKVLTIYIGDEAENDTRYVKVNDSKEIYTIAQENLNTILDKEVSDLWDMTVNYLSVNELNTLEINTDEDTHKIVVSRETSENEDGEEQETISYKLDGSDIDSTTFTTFYNKLVNMTGQRRLTEEYNPNVDPDMQVIFTDTGENETTVNFYEYDSSFYAVEVGEKVYLVNKMTVRDMMDSYDTLINGEEASTEDTVENDEEATEEVNTTEEEIDGIE